MRYALLCLLLVGCTHDEHTLFMVIRGNTGMATITKTFHSGVACRKTEMKLRWDFVKAGEITSSCVARDHD
jgi:hypothetical protein